MGRGLLRYQTPVEYFKEQVEAALQHQGVETAELTAYYLVNLLAGFVAVERRGPTETAIDDRPLALRLIEALQSGGARQRAGLRRVGDLSLFISGFFSESLQRKVVDVDYYVALGGYAYGSLSRQDEAFSTVFEELARKFVAYVDVLAEVSETSGLSSNADVLRLYEKWLRTGSRRDGELLVERGILPNLSIGNRFLQ